MSEHGPPRHIAIFANPLAGKGSAMQKLPVVVEYLRKEGITHTVFTLDYPSGLEGFTDVLVLGGDGTVNRLLNAYPDNRLPIGVIPGGSGNDLAVLLDQGMELSGCLETAVYGKTQWLDAGLCNGRVFMNCLGVGFDGEVAEDIGKVIWLRGKLKYLATVIQKIFRYRSVVMKATWDSGLFESRALTVMAANSRQTGGGFQVAPMADMTDGKLDLIVIGEISLFKRLLYLPRIRKGTHISLPFVQVARFRKLEIVTEKPLQAHLDGELLLAPRYRIEVLPGKFLFRVAGTDSFGNRPVPKQSKDSGRRGDDS